MSDERSKISLRVGPKRKGRPTISAPRQISGPASQDAGESSRGAGTVPKSITDTAPQPRARPPPQGGGKVSRKAS